VDRKVKDLRVLSPDPAACVTMNRELERIAAGYVTVFENDKQGNMYLDLAGMVRLFGPLAGLSDGFLFNRPKRQRIKFQNSKA
jgi:hypothetical protein